MSKSVFKFFLNRLKTDELFRRLSLEGINRNKNSVNMEDYKNIKLPPASNDYWTYYPDSPQNTNDDMAQANKQILPLMVALDLIEI